MKKDRDCYVITNDGSQWKIEQDHQKLAGTFRHVVEHILKSKGKMDINGNISYLPVREEWERSLIVKYLSENTESDETKAKKIVDRLGSGIGPEVAAVRCIGQPRHLQIVVNSIYQQRRCLRNVHKMKTSEFNGFYIERFISWEERKAFHEDQRNMARN